ncbi:MAG: AAA family ATPase [Oscillospiraceae bacterium]
MALIVNLFGSPGTGKSTGAAYIFSKLKLMGYNTELVTEYAKDLTWEENWERLSNQAVVFGEQLQRISRCFDKVDVIITDSPFLMGTLYNSHPALGQSFIKCVRDAHNYYSKDSANYFLVRVKPYMAVGRTQTEKQSDNLAQRIEEMLSETKQEYVTVPGNSCGYDFIITDVIKQLKKRGVDCAISG